jgi:anaerobic selenocysteine-containing dehydrogenase
MEPAWRHLALNVQVATKLNRTHLVTARDNWLLPCLGRTEIDRQNGQPQAHSTEDSTACVHGWKGAAEPASPQLRSEVAIIAGLAEATLPPNPKVDWDAWRSDYNLIRDAIAATWPEVFHDMNERMWERGGFHRPLPACERQWKTPSGKAKFITPRSLDEDDDVSFSADHRDVLQLMTIRSNDQFNTTIYGYEDRFRGVTGTRKVIFMHRNDIARLGFEAGQWVQLTTAIEPQVKRTVGPLQILPYDIPEGCCAAYYPECNPLVPLWHHAERSKVPAAKSVPITLRRAEPGSADETCSLPDQEQV